MGRIVKWVGIALGLVVVLALAGFGLASWKVADASKRIYVVDDPPLVVDRSAAAVAAGAHLFATRGCADCHGKDAGGKLFIDAGPVGVLYAPNLTRTGRLAGRSPDQIAAAIRHGVRADGRPLVFMPAEDFHDMSDGDVAALVAFLQSATPSPKVSGVTHIGPLGKVLYALGKFPLFPAEVIDHSPRTRPGPAVAATAQYGAYLAQGCTGCHGKQFAGQHVPGTPPDFPDSQNLTPAGIGTWTGADFRRALREGKRPDGTAINTFMPWQAFSGMTDTEIDALWAYLRTLPRVASKPRN